MQVGQTISHYRVISKLGEGGMGVVYLAEDIDLGRRVAIKTAKCKPDDYAFLNRFLREARASVSSYPGRSAADEAPGLRRQLPLGLASLPAGRQT